MKKLCCLVLIVLFTHTHQLIPSDNQDPITDETTTQVAGAVDVRALDDLIIDPDFPEPDPEQLQLPAWKIWLIRAGDMMLWTVQTGKDAVMTAYDRCKRLVVTSGEHDEFGS